MALAWPISRLQLSTDLERLLPADSPVAEAFAAMLADFDDAETIFIGIKAADRVDDPNGLDSEASAPVDENQVLEVAWALEEVLAASPRMASVRSGISEQDERLLFERILPYAVLLLDEQSLVQQVQSRSEPGALQERARLLRRQITTDSARAWVQIARSDPLGFAPSVPGLVDSLGVGLPIEPLTSSFWSRSERMALVVVEPLVDQLDRRAGHALVQELEAAMRSAAEQARGFEPEFIAVGGPLYAVADERAIRGNLLVTFATSAIGCLLVLWLTFGDLSAPLSILASVAVGLVWTFGILGAAGVEISAVGLGFAAVLVGLGVDYGIHCAVTFRERMLLGRSPRLAWQAVRQALGRVVLLSATTTGAAFLVLTLAELQLVRDIGLIVAIGIALVALATWSVGGVLLTSVRRATEGSLWPILAKLRLRPRTMLRRASLGYPAERPQTGAGSEALNSAQQNSACQDNFRSSSLLDSGLQRFVRLAQRSSSGVLVAILLLLLAALFGVQRLELTTDLRDLRPDSSFEEAERELSTAFGLGSETATVLVHGSDLDGALAEARLASAVLRREIGEWGTVTSVADLALGPRELRRRQALLQEIDLGSLVGRARSAMLAEGVDPRAFERGFAALEALARGDVSGMAQANEIPAGGAGWSLEDNGGARVALRLRLADDMWRQGPPAVVAEELQRVAPSALWASYPALATEIETSARDDLRLLVPVGVAAVMLVVCVSLARTPLLVAVAILPVLCGSLLTLGIWGWVFGNVDLVSIAVFPIVLGIGIDDGLHAAIRTQQLAAGERSAASARRLRELLPRAVAEVARPIFVTTITTTVGFASLLLSNMEALRRAGALVALGVLSCWLMTMFLLPALSGRRTPRGAERAGDLLASGSGPENE